MSSRATLAAVACLSSLALAQTGCVAGSLDSAPVDEETAAAAEAITAAEAIRVERAAFFSMSIYGYTQHNYQFHLAVKNLDYTKSVAVVARGLDGNWFDIPASYERSAGDGQEIWGAYFNGDLTRFAVRYTVLGQTYWDNNGGNDFTLVGQGQNLYHGINVLAGYQSPLSGGASTLFVQAYVRNLAYDKHVGVVYTTDGWQTVRVGSLGYQSYESYGYGSAPSPDEAGIELWNGSIEVGSSASRVEYALSYAVNGQTYWDNNHGANYVVTRQ